MADAHVLAYDVGTTATKACLYRLGEQLELVDSATVEYGLHVEEGGGVEQDPAGWWFAVCRTTELIREKVGQDLKSVRGLAFCAQMQGLVLVDDAGKVVRPAMSYLDARATEEARRGLGGGLLRIGGWNPALVLPWLRIAGGMAATAKDPLWKYHWVRRHEPEVFARVDRWLDVKDYLVLRATGQALMGRDSAHVTFLCDTRPGRVGWHRGLCRRLGVDINHLPPLCTATDRVGSLTAAAAGELELPAELPVFGGGGDLSMIPVGAGSLGDNATHIYIGTSGWVVATVDRRLVDVRHYLASIIGAVPGRYNYIAEQETAGACLRWVRDHLAADELGVYAAWPGADKERVAAQQYDLMNRRVAETEPGAGGVIFAPWMHGNRAPFDDPDARGVFFNLGLDTGKRQMVRAVLEGVAFHLRWLLETIEQRVPAQPALRFVGGGARSPVWAQILADVMDRKIELVADGQHAGAAGAAIVCGIGLGLIPGFAEASRFPQVAETFHPRPQHRALYDRSFGVYKQLHPRNRSLFRTLNRRAATGPA